MVSWGNEVLNSHNVRVIQVSQQFDFPQNALGINQILQENA